MSYAKLAVAKEKASRIGTTCCTSSSAPYSQEEFVVETTGKTFDKMTVTTDWAI